MRKNFMRRQRLSAKVITVMSQFRGFDVMFVNNQKPQFPTQFPSRFATKIQLKLTLPKIRQTQCGKIPYKRKFSPLQIHVLASNWVHTNYSMYMMKLETNSSSYSAHHPQLNEQQHYPVFFQHSITIPLCNIYLLYYEHHKINDYKLPMYMFP